MSAYKRLSCSLVDKETLIQALKLLELEFELYTSAQPLTGYENRTRVQKAEIIVRRSNLNSKYTGASNDLGFLWNPIKKEYTMLCSDYDVSSGIDKKVKQMYAAAALMQSLDENQFEYEIENKSLVSRKPIKINLVTRKVI